MAVGGVKLGWRHHGRTLPVFVKTATPSITGQWKNIEEGGGDGELGRGIGVRIDGMEQRGAERAWPVMAVSLPSSAERQRAHDVTETAAARIEAKAAVLGFRAVVMP